MSTVSTRAPPSSSHSHFTVSPSWLTDSVTGVQRGRRLLGQPGPHGLGHVGQLVDRRGLLVEALPDLVDPVRRLVGEQPGERAAVEVVEGGHPQRVGRRPRRRASRVQSAQMFDHEVIVVGGGAMGAATAWHLARDGRDVLLLEQFEALHARGSSHGRTRIFRVAYRDPGYTTLALAALPWWRTLEDEAGVALLDQCGQIDHGAPDALAEIEAVARPPTADRSSALSTGRGRATGGPACAPSTASCCRPTAASSQADRSVEALLRRWPPSTAREIRTERAGAAPSSGSASTTATACGSSPTSVAYTRSRGGRGRRRLGRRTARWRRPVPVERSACRRWSSRWRCRRTSRRAGSTDRRPPWPSVVHHSSRWRTRSPSAPTRCGRRGSA